MPRSKAQIYLEALKLNDQDRADLAGILIESLEMHGASDVDELWQKEIEKRTYELEKNPELRISWEEVATDLQKMIKSRA